MSYWAYTNTQAFVADGGIRIKEGLDVGVYRLGYNPEAGRFELSRMKEFVLPRLLLGEVDAQSDRIIESFNRRNGSLGVLASGEKGSGKSLLAKVVSSKRLAQGFSTILVDSPFGGAAYGRFLQSLPEGTMIFYDEVDKVFAGDEDQTTEEKTNGLLSILDGPFSSRVIHLFTCNDAELNQFIVNRPSRMLYHLRFSGLTEAEIRQFCERVLENQENTDGIVRISKFFSAFNFDMMEQLVREMNLFNETAEEACRILNIDYKNTRYRGTKFIYDKEGNLLRTLQECYIRPFQDYFDERHLITNEAGDRKAAIFQKSHHVTEEDNIEECRFRFVNEEGFELVFQGSI